MRRLTAARRPGHFDNRHSRWVARLKVAMPLAALLILSTLFLLADRRGSNDTIPYSDADLDRIVGDGRVASPSYAGVADTGAAITLRADEAWPEDPARRRIRAETVLGTWVGSGGATVGVASDAGILFGEARRARLEGDVSVRGAGGFRLRSEALEIDLDRAEIRSPGPVSGTGPPGRIEAGEMRIEERDGAPIMSFSDGVKLLYDPRSPDGD